MALESFFFYILQEEVHKKKKAPGKGLSDVFSYFEISSSSAVMRVLGRTSNAVAILNNMSILGRFLPVSIIPRKELLMPIRSLSCS